MGQVAAAAAAAAAGVVVVVVVVVMVEIVVVAVVVVGGGCGDFCRSRVVVTVEFVIQQNFGNKRTAPMLNN